MDWGSFWLGIGCCWAVMVWLWNRPTVGIYQVLKADYQRRHGIHPAPPDSPPIAWRHVPPPPPRLHK